VILNDIKRSPLKERSFSVNGYPAVKLSNSELITFIHFLFIFSAHSLLLFPFFIYYPSATRLTNTEMMLSVLIAFSLPGLASALPDDIPDFTMPPTPDPYESFSDSYDYNMSDEEYWRHHGYDDDDYGFRPTLPPSERKDPCPGPHTYRDQWGDCQCEDGYYYGDALSDRGCWTCNSSCGMNAECIFPGRCKCLSKFKGDGLHCEKVVPQILGIAPAQAWSDQTTEINISYLWDVGETAVRPGLAFCRLGSEKVQATMITDDTIVCLARPKPPQVIDVAIMFDEGPWSTDNFQLSYKNRFNVWGILPIVGLYALLITAVGACIWRMAGGQKKGDAEGEDQPFLGVAAASKGAGVAKKRSPRRRTGP
jgi:hypothetical protein